jgi:hypothetical protein
MGTVLYALHFDWTGSFVLLIPLVVGLGFFFIFKWYPAPNPGANQMGSNDYAGYVFFKWVGWIVGVFTIILFVCLLAAHIYDFSEKKNALENNEVLIVEGYVEQYHAMPFEGHDTEHFEINGVYFEYTNFEVSNGYNTPACYGGVVKENGQYLRIKYVDYSGYNVILYIEELAK